MSLIVLIAGIALAAILLYLLLAPFYIEVNSQRDVYRIRLQHLATASFRVAPESLFLELRMVGWHKTIDLLANDQKASHQKTATRKKTRHAISIAKVRAIIASFTVSKCYVVLDTGNQELNGILYTGVWWIGNYIKKTILINFCDENEIILELENNLFRVVRAYLLN